MTNLERIKITLCNDINAMSVDKLFEFLSEYDEDLGEYFSKEINFTCSKCSKTYGKCEANRNGAEVNYETCKSRFRTYCSMECE